MVQHIVMWKLKEGLDKEKIYNEMQAIFDKFKDDVSGMSSLYLHKGFAGCDIVLISTHENKKALEEYQSYTPHIEAKKYIEGVVASREFCDYEFN